MAVLPVGPAETFTTVAAALAAVTSVIDIIELRADIDEGGQLWGAGFNFAGFQTDGPLRVWDNTAVSDFNLRIVSSADLAGFIKDIHFKKSTAGDSNGCFSFADGQSTLNMTLSRCKFEVTSTVDVSEIVNGLGVKGITTFDKCEFIGDGTGNRVGQGITVGNFAVSQKVIFNNSIFRDCKRASSNRGAVAQLNNPQSEQVVSCNNCTFFNNFIGATITSSMFEFDNCLFIGNTSDLQNFTPSTPTEADYANCAFGQQTDTGGWPSTIIFGVVAADEVLDATPATQNLAIKYTAQSVGAGNNTGLTDDFIGHTRPQESTYDIGAYELNILPVGSGETFTTMAAAHAALNANNADVIELRDDINESVTWSNGCQLLRTDGPKRNWITTASLIPFIASSSLPARLPIQDINFDSQNVVLPAVSIQAFNTVGIGVTFITCSFTAAGADQPVVGQGGGMLIADGLVLERCEIFSGATNQEGINVISQVAGATRIDNCIFRGFTGASGKAIDVGFVPGKVCIIRNCTIDGNQSGITSNSEMTVQNCIFTNNVDDLTLSGGAIFANFENCNFEEQVTDPAFVNCLFGAVPANEYINAGANNYHLISGATSIDAGLTIPAITVDFDGVSRPQGAGYDIGAFEFQAMAPGGVGAALARRNGLSSTTSVSIGVW